MSISESYNRWASQYDSNHNKTRDLDALASRSTLDRYHFSTVVELGCGTGKNTEWLLAQGANVVGLDFSEGMLEKARQKIPGTQAQFVQADLNQPWPVEQDSADLITSSLTLEHIEDLNSIFAQAFNVLKAGGHFFICELHPFRQYSGSKAKFETDQGLEELEVYVHHVSEYTGTAQKQGFVLEEVREWFDEPEAQGLPRLLSLVLKKPN